MKEMNVQKVALTLAVFFAGAHLMWSVLIILGWAQPLMDFIFWAHMIDNPYHISGFTLMQSGVLIVVTFGVGYLLGWVFAWLWNTLHK